MNSIVQADYAKLEAIAAQLSHESERIRLVKQALHRRLSILRGGGWISEAASQFYLEMDDEVMPAVQRLEAALADGSDTVRQAIRIYYDAEEEAAACLNVQEKISVLYRPIFPDGGGDGIVNNNVTSTAPDPTTPPEGVVFTGLNFALLEGIPDETPGAQYETIENMSAEDKAAADAALDDPATPETVEGLKNSQDYNSCGPMVIASIIGYFQGDASAGSVFSRFVQLNADDPEFNPNGPTSLRELAPLAQYYGLTVNYISDGFVVRRDPDEPEDSYAMEDLIDLINAELKNSNPVAALINIDQNGVVANDIGGTNHWVTVIGTGEADDGTMYVQIWNPISDRIEYYDAEFFQESFVEGRNTLASFTDDIDVQEDV